MVFHDQKTYISLYGLYQVILQRTRQQLWLPRPGEKTRFGYTIPEFVIRQNTVSKFLSDLHDVGLFSNTSAGYRTAIGSIHRGFKMGLPYIKNPVVHYIVRGAFTLRLPPQRSVPAFNVGS